MKKTYFLMKENGLISEERFNNVETEKMNFENQRKDFQNKIISVSDSIQYEKQSIIEKEMEIIKAIRKHLKNLTLKRYYKNNKEKVEYILRKLNSDFLECGKSSKDLLEIEANLRQCINEQTELEVEELEELKEVFPQEELQVLCKYINSTKFKNLTLK